MMPHVRLYGRVVGNASHAQVTAGFRGELERREMLAGVVALDADEPPGSPAPGGPTAPVGIYTGPLERVHLMLSGTAHTHRLAMVAPNSDTLPKPLIWELSRVCTRVLVPSSWAFNVVRKCMPEMPLFVAPHGVDPTFQSDPERGPKLRREYDEEICTIVHFSTSPRQRKGTKLLVEAWDLLQQRQKLPSKARLVLILDYEAYARALEWHVDGLNPPNLMMHPQMGLAPSVMARFLSREVHIVCQPSRGEGFGMIPLEARACGVPVVATACTGHSQHLHPGLPGVVLVQHGADEPIDDQPGAQAPGVTPESIAAALLEAILTWPELEEQAGAAAALVHAQWSWRQQLTTLCKYLEELRS